MRRHALALTAATVLVVGAPTAASAQTWNHTDPAGDVVRSTYNTTTDTDTEAVDPTVTDGDVIHSTIKHNPRKVIATVRFRDLAVPGSNSANLFLFSVRTGSMTRDMTVTTDSDDTRGQHRFSRTSGKPVSCRGLSHRIDYTANTITMSVPRSCLGYPRRISAGVGVVRSTNSGQTTTPGTSDPSIPEVFENFVDDAHSPKVADDLVYSPRLRRG